MNQMKVDIRQNKFFAILVITVLVTLAICVCITSFVGANKTNASAATLAELQSQVASAEQMYVQAQIEKSSAEAKAEECKETIEYAEWKEPQLQEELGGRIRLMYVEKIGTQSLINCFLDANNLEEVLYNFDCFNRLNQKTIDVMNEVKDLKEDARKAQDEIWPAIETADAKANEAQGIIQSVSSAIQTLEANNIHVGVNEGSDSPYSPTPAPAPDPGPSPDPGPTPVPPEPAGDIVSRAYSCLNLPYGWGCAGPEYYDCSGLVSYAYTGQHIHSWSTMGIRDKAGNGLGGWYRTDSPSPGTCCCSMGHCGIYIGGGLMIHAPMPGDYVCIDKVQDDMLYYNR